MSAPIAVNLRSGPAAAAIDPDLRGMIAALDRQEAGQGRRLTVFCRPGEEAAARDVAPSALCVPIADEMAESVRGYLLAHPHRLLLCPFSVLDPMESPVPAATWIPNLDHESSPERLTSAELSRRKVMVGPSAVRSRIVLTLPETRDAIVDRYGVPPRKILVVPTDAGELDTLLRAMEVALVHPPAASAGPARTAACWCGASESETFSPDYLRCKECLTLFLRQPPAEDFAQVDEFDQGFYGRDYWFSHQKDLNLPSLEERSRADLSGRNVYWLSALLQHVSPGKRVLEFGCAHGSFVALMRQAGYQATGLEMSAAIAAFARATFDVPVLQAPIDRYPELRGSFDVLVAMDVLEHFLDPVAELQRYAEFLKPDGVCIFQTPCFYQPTRSWEELQRSGDKFLAHLHAEHINLMNEDSLRRMLARVGFGEVRVLPPFFGYDQFVVASRQAITPIEPADYEAALLQTPGRRMALAILDGLMFIKAAEDRLAALQQTSAAAAERLTILQQQAVELEQLRADIGSREAELTGLRSQLAAAQVAAAQAAAAQAAAARASAAQTADAQAPGAGLFGKVMRRMRGQ
ncbi:MAG: methyltransferase domain-containing protein [Candidatus Solibacter sp.]